MGIPFRKPSNPGEFGCPMSARKRSSILLAAIAVTALASSLPAPAGAQSQRLIVEQSRDGKFFVINGVEFQARQYCRRVKTGDEVTFLTGSSSGRCTLASFLDLNTGDKCEVWCTEPPREMP